MTELGVSILNRRVKVDFIEKMTFAQKCECDENLAV